jgi:flagellar hook protein FlgE
MSFFTSLSGLSNAQTELDTIANNLANAQTTGFKGSRVNFSDIVAGSSFTNPKMIQGIGSMVKNIDQNFNTGPMQSTGSALDLAVNGQGFFTVRSAVSGSNFYTRNGNFSTDSTGFITDQTGNRVQILAYSAGSYAATPSDALLPPLNSTGAAFAGAQISTDGVLTASYADGTSSIVGKVALASFISPMGLLQVGNQDWQATGISGVAMYNAPNSGGTGSILSGSLEQSNVNVSSELVNMISAQQYFQANSKAISAGNTMITAIMNAIGG